MRATFLSLLLLTAGCKGLVSDLTPRTPTGQTESEDCSRRFTVAAPGDQWAPTGPSGAAIASIAMLGADVVLMGTQSARASGVFYTTGTAIFRSTDGGKTVNRVESFDVDVQQLIPVNGTSRIWALAGGPWLSDDAGLTFSAQTDGLFPQAGIRGLTIAAGEPERAYLLVSGTPDVPGSAVTNIYKREGGSWTQLAASGISSFPGGPLASIAADPVTRDRLYAVDGSRLYVSDDAGATFTVLSSGTALYSISDLGSPRRLFIDPADPTHLLLTTYDQGLLESKNGGTSFSQALTGPAASRATSSVAFAQDALYVATSDDGLVKITAAEQSSVGECLVDQKILSVAVDPGASSVLLVGTHAGLSRSEDSAARFASVGMGLDQILARVTMASAETAFLLTPAGPFEVIPSTSEFDRPGQLGAVIAASDLKLLPDGQSALISLDRTFSPTSSRLSEGVLLWKRQEKLVSAISGAAGEVAALAVDSTGRAYAYQRPDLRNSPGLATGLVTAAPGASFTSTGISSSALDETALFRFNSLALATDGTVYAGIRKGLGEPALVRSNDSGQSAQELWSTTGFSTFTVAVDGAGAIYLAGANSADAILRSTDQGATFAPYDEGLLGSGRRVYGLAFTPAGALIAATGAGLFIRPAGEAFQDLNAGLPSEVVAYSVAAVPDPDVPVLIATTDRGVFWRRMP